MFAAGLAACGHSDAPAPRAFEDVFREVMPGSVHVRALASPRTSVGKRGAAIDVTQVYTLRLGFEPRTVDRVGFVTEK